MLVVLSKAAGCWLGISEQGTMARAPLPLGGFLGNHHLLAEMCVLGEGS